ncbi:hypothetical protein K439DRAFT_1398887 [Ramaria rubella]|nr:hypothetical protein K439DRAFT_1398887 [Ramaria rubella]
MELSDEEVELEHGRELEQEREHGHEHDCEHDHEDDREHGHEEERARARGVRRGSLSPDEQERKKMRDKLAKLHRFLGSRVPVELALGAGYVLHDHDLPKAASSDRDSDSKERERGGDGAKGWMRRRRSSSSAALPGYVIVQHPERSGGGSGEPQRADGLVPEREERIKDDLERKERLLNVKRANKMEQMFGARPPAMLYQTRAAQASLPPSLRQTPRNRSPESSPPRSPQPASVPNPNTSAYKGKGRTKRPGTSESRQGLLLGEEQQGEGFSSAYMYYRHSLLSLSDIIDKDDKESLAELHQYINASSTSDIETETPIPTPTFAFGSPPSLEERERERRHSGASLERRRSLPARTSMLSIASTISITLPEPDPSGFQQRRRRAAKLTNFFGVNYRDLFGDVLWSIEMGMREEVKEGVLQVDEMEDLMGKLRKLKVRRDEITF